MSPFIIASLLVLGFSPQMILSNVEEDLTELCKTKETCDECETTPGCGWCSDPSNKQMDKRCSSRAENEGFCPQSSLQQKFSGGALILPERRTGGTWFSLRPEKFDLKMNVGDIENLELTYTKGKPEISHSFPDNVEVKIQKNTLKSTWYFKKYHVQIELKSCSKNATDWKSSQWIKLESEDGTSFVSIDFQTFCSCSCDKPFTKEICRNDKKVTDANKIQ